MLFNEFLSTSSVKFQNISCLRFIYINTSIFFIVTVISKHFMFKVHFCRFKAFGRKDRISKHFMFKVHVSALAVIDNPLKISKHFMFKVHSSLKENSVYFLGISKHFMFKVHLFFKRLEYKECYFKTFHV